MTDDSRVSLGLETFTSLDAAFRAALRDLSFRGRHTDLITDPTSVGSAFGSSPRRTVEVIAAGFAISAPRARHLISSARPMNEAFAIANTLWTLSGSTSASDILPYNSRGSVFAPAGVYSGAVGARIRRSPVGDQIALVVATLRAWPSSRRAAVQIFSSADLQNPPRDTPCTLSLQYFLRDGKLEAVTTMRSQSAAMVLPYDVYLFTMLQELIATELRVELGTYHHLCGSLHYYEDEEALVEKILNEDVTPYSPQMLPMPDQSLSRLPEVIDAERSMRTVLAGDPDADVNMDAFALDPYWRNILAVLHRGLRQGR